MLQKRKNISIAGLYVCLNSIFWVTGALYCACFPDPGDEGYNDFIIGERKKKTTVTLKQDEIKKYFPPEYDEQKIRTVICQLLEEWSNQNH